MQSRKQADMQASSATTWIIAATLIVLPTAATGSTSQTIFLSTLTDLRGLDPSVQDVPGKVLTNGGGNSGCGQLPQGDLVAVYCPKDRQVYATRKTTDIIHQEYGAAAVQYLAAHEMAHARQHAVTGFSKAIVYTSVLDELQADCIAGAYLNRRYGYTTDSPEGESIRRFAYSIGDRMFFHHDWHGNPRLRVAALSRGLRTGDPIQCLSSSRFNYASIREKGAAFWQQLRQLRNR